VRDSDYWTHQARDAGYWIRLARDSNCRTRPVRDLGYWTRQVRHTLARCSWPQAAELQAVGSQVVRPQPTGLHPTGPAPEARTSRPKILLQSKRERVVEKKMISCCSLMRARRIRRGPGSGRHTTRRCGRRSSTTSGGRLTLSCWRSYIRDGGTAAGVVAGRRTVRSPGVVRAGLGTGLTRQRKRQC
jgi:hypothetical protein